MNETTLKTLYLPEMEDQCQQRLTRLMRRAGLKHPLIVDVGANTGQSIKRFKSVWPTSVIHAFEPNPSTFQQLSENHGNDRMSF